MEWRELIVDGFERLPGSGGGGARGGACRRPRLTAPRPGWQSARLDGVAPDPRRGRPDRRSHGRAGPLDAGRLAREVQPARRTTRIRVRPHAGEVKACRSPSARSSSTTSARPRSGRSSTSPRSRRRTSIARSTSPGYTPRPTVGVRLLSIVADCHRRAGEASYIRGLIKARGRTGPASCPEAAGARSSKPKTPRREAAPLTPAPAPASGGVCPPDSRRGSKLRHDRHDRRPPDGGAPAAAAGAVRLHRRRRRGRGHPPREPGRLPALPVPAPRARGREPAGPVHDGPRHPRHVAADPRADRLHRHVLAARRGGGRAGRRPEGRHLHRQHHVDLPDGGDRPGGDRAHLVPALRVAGPRDRRRC